MLMQRAPVSLKLTMALMFRLLFTASTWRMCWRSYMGEVDGEDVEHDGVDELGRRRPRERRV